MECPHCQVHIHPNFWETRLSDATGEQRVGRRQGLSLYWAVSHMECPSCHDAILVLNSTDAKGDPHVGGRLIHPRTANRAKAPPELPKDLAEDFNEACLVLSDSPKASAALSRRCLQGVLRDKGFTQKDLALAIDAVLASNQLPSSLAGNLDAVRNIGNFAAHPMKNSSSGSILAVEPEEAEWNLDVLEELFDFFYVQPKKAEQKRAALDAKLAAAGKPAMKT